MTKLLNTLPMLLAEESSSEKWANTIFNALEKFLVPILIILCGVGLIWAVVVGVQMIKADTKDKRDENKARLINIGITIVSVIALIAVFYALKNWIPNLVSDTKTEYGELDGPTSMIGKFLK